MDTQHDLAAANPRRGQNLRVGSSRRRPRLFLTTAAILVALVGAAWAQTKSTTRNQAEVTAVESLLAEHPAGVGRPISDRAAWEAIGATKRFQALIAEAEQLVKKPLPAVPDELYLDFSRTGNRNPWQNAAGERHRRLKPLVVAECIENKGRFLPAIEQLVDALCAEKTWVLPAHDKDLRNFRGEQIIIDL